MYDFLAETLIFAQNIDCEYPLEVLNINKEKVYTPVIPFRLTEGENSTETDTQNPIRRAALERLIKLVLTIDTILCEMAVNRKQRCL